MLGGIPVFNHKIIFTVYLEDTVPGYIRLLWYYSNKFYSFYKHSDKLESSTELRAKYMVSSFKNLSLMGM